MRVHKAGAGDLASLQVQDKGAIRADRHAGEAALRSEVRDRMYSPGRRPDDLDARVKHASHGRGRTRRDPLVAQEQCAVEVGGEESDIGH